MRYHFALCVTLLVTGLVCAQSTQPASTSPASPPAPRRDRDPLMLPETVHIERDVIYAHTKDDAGKDVDLTLDAMFLKHSDGQPMPVIVYIHGGGFTGGSKESGLQECIPFALGGYLVASVDYRLAPASRFPAALYDCKAAIRFLRKNAESLGIDPKRIGVWGRSAGGYLASMVGVTGNAPEIEGDVGVTDVTSEVQAVVTFAGPVDFGSIHQGWGEGAAPTIDHKSADSPTRVFLGGDPTADAELNKRSSVLTYIDAKDPPFHIVHGEADGVVPSHQALDLRDILEVRGVSCTLKRLPGGGHDLGGPRILLEAAKFFDDKLGGHSTDAIRELGKKK